MGAWCTSPSTPPTHSACGSSTRGTATLSSTAQSLQSRRVLNRAGAPASSSQR